MQNVHYTCPYKLRTTTVHTFHALKQRIYKLCTSTDQIKSVQYNGPRNCELQRPIYKLCTAKPIFKLCTTAAHIQFVHYNGQYELCTTTAHVQTVHYNSPYKLCTTTAIHPVCQHQPLRNGTTTAHTNSALQKPIQTVHFEKLTQNMHFKSIYKL
jgi:hypothetical protein